MDDTEPKAKGNVLVNVDEIEIAIEPSIPVQTIPQVLMRGGKMERATPLSVAWNDPRARLAVPMPRTTDGADEWTAYLEEFRDFTGLNDEHDDQVDWTAHAFNIGTRLAVSSGGAGIISVADYGGRNPGTVEGVV